ncbi:hypothetical protein HMPREF9441_03911 [Paraprevotella clara YIT 11840]|uniref:Uncharacterized protein n=1 Tax=Paraprevotella clara YIT 11840 TaxID=762968 RepID=G5SWY3_9BACT|nr:hypothetical protein HMPREF9441_03911 [Paraprevotella clara YIT 11840]
MQAPKNAVWNTLIFQSHENDFSFGAERFSNLLQTKDNKPRKRGENSLKTPPKYRILLSFSRNRTYRRELFLPIFSLSKHKKSGQTPAFSNLYPI